MRENERSFHIPFKFSLQIILFGLCLLGLLSIPFISFQLNPSPRVSSLFVAFSFPKASPEVVEKEVTSKLEGALSRLRNLQKIKSTSRAGRGNIEVIFNEYADMDKSRLEMSMIIRQIYEELPPEVSYPTISFQSVFQEEIALLTYNLISDLESVELNKLLQEAITPKLLTIHNVTRVDVQGLQQKEWIVALDEDKLDFWRIDLDLVKQAIKSYFRDYALGLARWSDDGLVSLQIKASTDQQDLIPYLRQIIVTQIGSRTIYLSDLARIELVHTIPNRFFRINGEDAITMVIFTAINSNQVRLAKAIKKRLELLSEEVAAQLQLDLADDRSEYLNREIQKIFRRVIFAIGILLVLILLVTASWRYLALITLSLLSSLLISNLFFLFYKVEFHLYSLAGWTLSIGIVLDNIIIMVDHLKNKGKGGIFLALLAATLTSIGALFVIFLFREKFRNIFQDFFWVFAINLLVSLGFALIFLPALFQRFKLGNGSSNHAITYRKRMVKGYHWYRKYIQFALRWRRLLISLIILAFGLPFFLLPKKLDSNHYLDKLYNSTLGQPVYQERIRPYWDVLTGGLIKPFLELKGRFRFAQREREETKLSIQINLPDGSNIQQLNEISNIIENKLGNLDGVEQFQARGMNPRKAQIEVFFPPAFAHGPYPRRLKAQLEEFVNTIGGADFVVWGVGRVFSNVLTGENLNLHLKLLGYNYDQIWATAHQMRQELLQNRRIKEVYIGSEQNIFAPDEKYLQLSFRANQERLSTDFSFRNLSSALQDFSGDQAVVARGPNHPIRLKYETADNKEIWDLKHALQQMNSGDFFRFKEFVSIEEGRGQTDIVKEDQQYRLYLSFNFIGDFQQSKELIEAEIEKFQTQLPLGYKVLNPAGNRQNQLEGSGAFLIIFFSLLAIFIIGATLFNSIKQAIIPILLIFPSFIGIFLGVVVFNFRFDHGGLASFLLVAGLSVNMALFILNDFNNEKKKHPRRSDLALYIKAFNSKIRPIFFATISTVLSLLPFILFDQYEDFWYALSICTICGLLSSLAAGVLFLPMLFLHPDTSIYK